MSISAWKNQLKTHLKWKKLISDIQYRIVTKYPGFRDHSQWIVLLFLDPAQLWQSTKKNFAVLIDTKN